jgi:hypothetical protein
MNFVALAAVAVSQVPMLVKVAVGLIVLLAYIQMSRRQNWQSLELVSDGTGMGVDAGGTAISIDQWQLSPWGPGVVLDALLDGRRIRCVLLSDSATDAAAWASLRRHARWRRAQAAIT